jgi:hypothetical protein
MKAFRSRHFRRRVASIKSIGASGNKLKSRQDPNVMPRGRRCGRPGASRMALTGNGKSRAPQPLSRRARNRNARCSPNCFVEYPDGIVHIEERLRLEGLVLNS